MKNILGLPVAALMALGLVCNAGAHNQPWRFMVFGDTRGTSSGSQVNTNILSELASAATNEHPAFVLVPGDLVYAGNLPAFQAWSNIMAPVYQAGIPVYPVLGNHDDDSDPTAFTTFFGPSLPANGPVGEIGRTYAIVWSNVLVLALDTYVNPHRVNTNWVASVLAANTRPHVFAMGHDPAFKVNHADCLDDYPASRDAFWNSLSNAHGRIYFAGHDHFYDHMRLDDGDGDVSDDLHQFIVGSGGAPFSADVYPYQGGANGVWTPARIAHEQTNGYVIVEIDGYLATATWHHRVGANLYAATSESFSYDARPKLRFSDTDGQLALNWSGAATLQSASEPAGPFTDVPDATCPYVIADPSGAAQFYRLRVP